jgi:hypothetical protein
MTIDKKELQKLHDDFYSKAKYKKVEINVQPMSQPSDKIYYIHPVQKETK